MSQAKPRVLGRVSGFGVSFEIHTPGFYNLRFGKYPPLEALRTLWVLLCLKFRIRPQTPNPKPVLRCFVQAFGGGAVWGLRLTMGLGFRGFGV